MTTRTNWYKAAQPNLQGPHFNQPGQLYLPNTVHEAPLEIHSAFGQGIHYVAHRRVASRWAQIVLQIEVLGEQFKIPEQVSPRYRSDIPRSLAMGKYNKYRSDRVRVKGIVGIAAYGRADLTREHEVPDEVVQRYPWSVGSYIAAKGILAELNHSLAARGHRPMRLTGNRLEALRSDSFCLWELESTTEPERERFNISVDVNVFRDLAPDDVRKELERAAERGLGTLSFVQGVGVAKATFVNQPPFGT